MPQTPSPARKAAIDLMDQVLGQGRPLSEIRALEALAPADRAAAQRLATQTFRGLERADRVLKPHLRKAPALRVMNILRLGAVELCSGGAAHGVVSDCVEIAAKGKRTAGAKGLINAVLRKVAEEGPNAWQILRVPRLPKWLRHPLVEAWGPDVVKAMEQVQFQTPPLDITPKSNPASVAQSVRGIVLPTGSVRVAAAGQVTTLPGFAEGDWWVQDAAAALPVQLLGDVAGKRVLDLCAAPGGKTLQLAAAGADVTALDLSAHRIKRVQANLDRTGLKAELITGDALEHTGTYDAILLDAPCSATGTLRRHPDLPHVHQGDRIGSLIGLQAEMLDHALSLLAPGGRLVYATCSLLPDEGECQIEDVVKRDDVTLIKPHHEWIDPLWHAPEGGLRLRPDYWADQGGMDGFFMAVLEKR